MPLQAAADFTARSVDWLWPSRLPLGYLSILDGDPNLGKSFLALDLAARLSTGRPLPTHLDSRPGISAALPGPSAEPKNSIVLAAEDGADDVILSRLDALGADTKRIFLWRYETGEAAPQFPAGIEGLRADVRKTQARLVVIDPLFAFLDPRLAVSHDPYVRAGLKPLADLARDFHCCVLMIRHLTKSAGARALYRGAASLAYAALCRSTLLVARNPKDQNQCVLAPVKNNLDAPAPSLLFRIHKSPTAPPLPDARNEAGPNQAANDGSGPAPPSAPDHAAPLTLSDGERHTANEGSETSADGSTHAAPLSPSDRARGVGGEGVVRNDDIHPHDGQSKIETPKSKIEWLGPTSLTADELLHLPAAHPELDRAKVFLATYLAATPQPARKAYAAAKALGITANTLKRAFAALELVRHRINPFTPRQYNLWAFPGQPIPDEHKNPDDIDLEEWFAPLRNPPMNVAAAQPRPDAAARDESAPDGVPPIMETHAEV